MLISCGLMAWWVWQALWRLEVSFSGGRGSVEQIALRWVHIVAGILWVGFLCFFVLAVAPALKRLDPGTRAKIFPELASRGLWWLRWSAVVTWLAGFRYFMILAKTDAVNAGRPYAWGGWIAIWFGCWLAAFAIEMALIQAGGALGNKFVTGALVLFIMTATSWLVVSLLAQPGTSNRTLCIAIGGGLGTVLFLNVWGIAWRCQKRLIAWTRAFAEQGTPMPPEAEKLTRMATLTMHINFWLTFPMLFFMAASAHFPFLSGK
ncbi:MAG TPA: urate hydroxylase PuuD [Candidatus Dormibacteraeota bacterium]|nr:urate hydroxylase PuuD [Candidatus Dormibacteraeota bacterium]